jgi:hypothetical protein
MAERFTGLLERTHTDLLAYALRRVAEPSDAADVVADTYLVAWRRLDQVPADAERPWLFGVARKVLAVVADASAPAEGHRASGRRRGSSAGLFRLRRCRCCLGSGLLPAAPGGGHPANPLTAAHGRSPALADMVG